jgi:fumarate reductase subunit D
MMALRRWIGADPGGAQQAVQRTASCPPKQLLAGAVLTAMAVLASLELRAYTWLALFAGLMLPLVAVAALLLTLQRVWPVARTWGAVWAALFVTLPIAVLVAGQLYDTSLDWAGIDVHNAGQVMVAETLLLLLLLVLPLWMAQHRARTLHIAQLSQAALASDLKALQAQIEPHFLYNTLANTRYLVRHEPERAVDMLDHLIAYLRSALPDLRSPMSTLGRECELAGHYLELMAIRYGERLSVKIACADDVRDLALPPLMLMPLVENAVQHGVEPHAGAVTVTVQAQRASGGVLVAVRDNGAGVGHGQAVLGSGVGLRNVRQRLEALYGPAASLRLSMGADGWTAAELTLPVTA